MEQIFAYISNHLDTALVSFVAILLAWDRWRSGSGNLRKEIAADYKERNAQLEAKLKENADAITATNLEVAKLTGIIQEKDKHIDSLTKILQGRNPELLELLKEIKEGNNSVHKFMEEVYDFMKKSNEELGYQTEILEKSQQREKKIDRASKKHTGVPLRLPNGGSKKKITKVK